VYFEQGEKAKAVIFYEACSWQYGKKSLAGRQPDSHIVSNLAFVYQMQEEYAKGFASV